MATLSEALATALAHHRAGRLDLAQQIYRRILAVEPDHPDALHLLGFAAHQVGDDATAVEYIRRAIALYPSSPAYHNNLGIALRDQGNLSEAILCYRRAIELKPDVAEVYNNLGNALRAQGDLAEAAACFQRALEIRPDLAEAHSNLGNALKELGNPGEAIACYQRALELAPNMAKVHSNLGSALRDQGKLDEAIACFRRALQLKPDYAEAYTNLGAALQVQGKLGEAMACYQQALHWKPDYSEALNNLGNAEQQIGNLDEAIACYQHALQLKPDSPEFHSNLGNAWKDAGRHAEALASYRRALELKPDYTEAHSNLVYTLHFCADYDAPAIAEAHRLWAERHAEPLAPFLRPHANDRTPDRRLRIGYVSPDLREHPVGRLLLPLLEAHDHRDFEIFCYSSLQVGDAITDRSRAAADGWRDAWALSDEQLADAVRQDRIDILVDLSMHTAHNRLRVFARKPAPVQVTYLAYCGTTGLSTIDYRFTDPYLDPPGVEEPFYSEQSIRLPETYWCYQAVRQSPPVGPLPARETGQVTFGSLNNFCKVTAPTLAAWSRLLQSVPHSRLLLHTPAGGHRERLRDVYAQQGVSAERIEFVGRLPMLDYLGLSQRMDVALDPFPYGGGTTTCDALWMGVPVVSLAGRMAVGRGGLSILSNVGLSELVARDTDQYVRIAADLARDLPRLAELRAALRQRMQESPLMDAPRFARHVEAAYRAMWRRWCAQ